MWIVDGNKMNIGIVSLYNGKSGKKGFYNSQEIGVARAFSKLVYNVIVFFTSSSKNIEEERIDFNIKIINVPGFIVGCHSKFNWNILLKYKIDVVHSCNDNQIFAPSLFHFCDKHNIRIYSYLGVIQSDTNSVLKKKIMGLLCERNIQIYKKHKCFVKTNTIKSELEKLGVVDITVAPVGLDTSIIPVISETKEKLLKELQLPEDKIILLFVGRLDEYKKPLDAIELLNKLSDKYYLVMIGNGTLKNKIVELIGKYHIQSKIKCIGKIENKEIHKFYKISDYFLNFNNNEIFGMSILEAMYQGCNVIAVDAPGPRDIIKNNYNGFLVDNINQMKQIVENNRKIDSKEAIESINNCYSWDNTAKIFAEWINKK